ncbi:MAG: restriction endonuclease [Patescibacteria group bacterium]
MNQNAVDSRSNNQTMPLALHSLGWRNFQDLCGSILRHEFGQSFKTFADSNDGGRDGAYYGKWERSQLSKGSQGFAQGATVLQCKFTIKADSTLSLSMLEDELGKITKLVHDRLCDNYVLITNARVTGDAERKICAAIKLLGVKEVYVQDGNWVCDTIKQNQSLRLYVPRVYGLGDLSQIIDARSYIQAQELLDQLDGLSTFVVTKSYQKAADAIKNEGFVLLLGEPSSGKSVIAATLAMAAADKWNSLVIRVSNAEEFKDHWNPNEPNQFFWIDDAFGAVRHSQSLTDGWAKILPAEVNTAIKKGAKVVMTSRDYVYKQAKPLLKDYAFPLLKESQVVIDVSALSLDEKRRILYNHLKRGRQPKEFRAKIKPHLDEIAHVKKFLPEVARRFSVPSFTKHIDPSSKSQVVNFMENPKDYLSDVFDELEPKHQAVMALIYGSEKLTSPVRLDPNEAGVMGRFGANTSDILSALHDLEGTFLRYNRNKGEWRFHHPTIREGFARYIIQSPELTDILIQGFSLVDILEQVDCGTGKVEGQLIRLQPSLYDQVLDRLNVFWDIYSSADGYTSYYLRLRLLNFLNRGNKQFLQRAMTKHRDLIERIMEDSLSGEIIGNPAIPYAGRLLDFDMLDQSMKEKIADYYMDVSVSIPDGSWLTYVPARKLIDDSHATTILANVRLNFVPEVDSTIDEWETNDNSEIEDYYSELRNTIDEYRLQFTDDEDAYQRLTEGLGRIEEIEDERARFQSGSYEDGLYDDDRPTPPVILAERNIFDDVDV